jgi:glycosyltransferase involved in cell wall biosynthesis
MKVLFISHHVPVDPRTSIQGIFRRMRMFVDALKSISSLDMIFYVPRSQDTSRQAAERLQGALREHWDVDAQVHLCPRRQVNTASKWSSYWSSISNFYMQGVQAYTSGPEQVAFFDHCLDSHPDLIFAHRLPAICPVMRSKRSVPPVFLDLDDIEHIQLLRQSATETGIKEKILDYASVPALMWGERKAARCVHRMFVCSDLDRAYLRKLLYGSSVTTVPNSITIPEPESITPKPTLLFFASYLFPPNAEAAEFLIRKVWPLVHREMPEARLIVAGNNPEYIPSYSKSPSGVEFPGLIVDQLPLYREARVVCAPVLRGAGTRVKIVEAAAYGKPVVATRIAAEGLDMEDGREVLLRDEPEGFASACLTLLRDAQFCETLGMRARAIAQRHYDRTQTIESIRQMVNDVFLKHHRPAAEWVVGTTHCR